MIYGASYRGMGLGLGRGLSRLERMAWVMQVAAGVIRKRGAGYRRMAGR